MSSVLIPEWGIWRSKILNDISDINGNLINHRVSFTTHQINLAPDEFIIEAKKNHDFIRIGGLSKSDGTGFRKVIELIDIEYNKRFNKSQNPFTGNLKSGILLYGTLALIGVFVFTKIKNR
jgi:hypothetical protein